MSFRLKITIITTLLVAMLFSLGSTIMIHRSYMDSLTREEKEAVDSVQMVTSIIQISYESGTESGDEQLVQTLRRLGTYQTSSDVFLLYKGKTLIYGNAQGANIDVNIDRLSSEMNGEGDIYVSYDNEFSGMEYIIGASEIIIDDDTYIICVCRDVSYVSNMRKRLHQMFIYTFIALLFTSGVISWLLSTFLVRHLSRLTKATREIADGNLSYRSNIETNDEIGELSQDFDKMAEELEGNVSLLEKAAEEKDRFMGAFTHELKTPMTSIIGYAELLRTQELDDEDREDALQYIYSEAKRLENMSLKLLQLFVADKEKLEMKKVSPKEMVEDIVTHLRPTLSEQNISIICRTEEGLALLEPDLVRTLLINLIDNARKAMDKKGNIRVDQKMEEGGVTFIITDNGKGMPKEAIEHVTEAFYRVDKARSRAQGGAGLGLSLVSKIVELHNGTIDFSSEPGIGTVITVKLKGGEVNV
ncbi:Signal transduction histidine kinase [Lachnospiraceae bacterium NE2001]|nr:Signal transduction histidine kinase [Lachnospiraceae bacterium NE2001]